MATSEASRRRDTARSMGTESRRCSTSRKPPPTAYTPWCLRSRCGTRSVRTSRRVDPSRRWRLPRRCRQGRPWSMRAPTSRSPARWRSPCTPTRSTSTRARSRRGPRPPTSPHRSTCAPAPTRPASSEGSTRSRSRRGSCPGSRSPRRRFTAAFSRARRRSTSTCRAASSHFRETSGSGATPRSRPRRRSRARTRAPSRPPRASRSRASIAGSSTRTPRSWRLVPPGRLPIHS